MELVRATEANIFQDKNIICVERSALYLEELCSAFPVLDGIRAIVDENPRNQGTLLFRNRKIPVCGMEYLKQTSLENTIILITSDYFEECFDRLKELSGKWKKSLPGPVYFFASRESAWALHYREQYKGMPLEPVIVFRSGPHADGYVKGMDFGDNAKALFDYALSIGLNRGYELVWIVKSPEEFGRYRDIPHVSFLPFEASVSEDRAVRENYYRVLCLARYFFFTDAYGFVRNCRKDQVRVQLWHGCGFKKRLSRMPCERRYEYMTVTSPWYASIHAKEFGLRSDQMLVTGCAKTDWLFTDSPGLTEQLSIPLCRHLIFWMPTYRFSEKRMHKPVDGTLYEETGLPLLSSMEALCRVEEELAGTDTVLVIKLHPFQDRASVRVGGFSHIVLLENETLYRRHLQINQVLGHADALISDYSSTAVDFLILDRPMAFLVEDEKAYGDTRGFVVPDLCEYLPGEQVRTLSAFLDFIKDVACGTDRSKEKRAALRELMHQYKDSGSCRRILETLGIIEA